MSPSQKTVFEYPTGLSGIPFASFLQIEKYSYDEAQKKVQTSQNDALGSLANSRIADIVDSGVDTLANVYGSGEDKSDKRQRKIENDRTFYSKGFLGMGRTKYDIADADDSTIVRVNGVDMTIGQIKAEKKRQMDLAQKGLKSSKCHLPLPNEFQYKYGADWNNEFKLGTLALAADDALRFGGIVGGAGVAGGLVQNQINKITSSDGNKDKSKNKKIANIEKTINSTLGASKTAANPFKINSELSPKNIAGLA